MPRFDAILFDLGNTLVYFDAEWPAVLVEADRALFRELRRLGLDLDEGDFLQTFRAQIEAYYRERDTEFIEYTTQYVLRTLLAGWGYPEVPGSVLRPALDAMYAVTQAHWQPEADAIPTLKLLREQGYRLGLVSNAGDDPDVQALIDKAGVRPYLDVIVSSAARGIRKPNPRIFLEVLERLGAAPGRSAMVGDMLGADVLGARNAGMFAIWITRRADKAANQAHLDTILPDAVISTLSDLPALLARIP